MTKIKLTPDQIKAIEARIKQLEEQQKEVIMKRKAEIAKVVVGAGGIDLDNRLLAGFVAFASNKANSDSSILKQMREVGKSLKFPSKRI